MSNYWIGDAAGRVLGPVSIQTLQDLFAKGRLRGVDRASVNGKEFKPIDQFPEVAAIASGNAPTSTARGQEERTEAARVRVELERLRGRPVHEIFGLSAGAGVEAYRAKFFLMVKRIYPDRLHTDVSPELRQAYTDAFEFLSSLMAHIERDSAGASPPQRAGAAASRNAPTYRVEDFIGFERNSKDFVDVKVRVGRLNANMFTQHPLINISSDSFFLVGLKGLAVNTVVNVCFQFEEPAKELEARGRVVWENSGDPRQPLGLGIRFISISEPDRQFIKDFAKRAG
ncbi:MAG TPA: PilZ domain-containing protein [Myxococcaceae bacterium]|nr:PilZ domain-containing protein [Myxococcaceae bacterium]